MKIPNFKLNIQRKKWEQLVANGSDEKLFAALPELEDDDPISLVLYADSEICNGGFFQYYSNGIFDVQEHIRALELLGLDPFAELVRESLAVFPNGIQPKRGEEVNPIEDEVASLIGGKDKFHLLDDVYFELTKGLVPGVVAYVRRNSDHYWKLKEQSL